MDITCGFGSQSLHGECQQKLDVVAGIRFISALKNGRVVAAIILEEREEIIHK